MRWLAGLLFLALFAGAGPLGAAQAAGPLFCGPCFWVHGRLFAANGAPTFRIWRIGTKRILGVRGAGPSAGALAVSMRQLVEPDAFQVNVYGDFHVCPLTSDRPGRMRFVFIQEARHLLARPSHPQQ